MYLLVNVLKFNLTSDCVYQTTRGEKDFVFYYFIVFILFKVNIIFL